MNLKRIIFLLFFPVCSYAQIKTVNWSGNYIGLNVVGGYDHYFNQNFNNFYDAYIQNPPYDKSFYENIIWNRDNRKTTYAGGSLQFSVSPNKATNHYFQAEIGFETSFRNLTPLSSLILFSPSPNLFYVLSSIEERVYRMRFNSTYMFTTNKKHYRKRTAYFGIGPEFNYDLFSKVNIPAYIFNPATNKFGDRKDIEIGNIKKGINLSLISKAGIEIPLRKSLHLNAEVNYRHGVTANLGYRFFEVGRTNFALGLRYYFVNFGMINRGPCPSLSPPRKKKKSKERTYGYTPIVKKKK